MMESIKGRANDFIVLPDGQIIASCFLVIIMQAFHDIAQYRVIQEQKDGLTVQVVKGQGYNGSTTYRIKKEIEEAVQNRLDVKVETVEEIGRDSSGKIRTVVSNIIPEFQGQLTDKTGIFVRTLF
jgi:phenylacetate-CoA ligase